MLILRILPRPININSIKALPVLFKGCVILKRVTFVKNAAILTVTTLFLRGIGMFFRVFISNSIGTEGMGLYQLITSIYFLLITIATSGFTAAVTRMVVEEMNTGSKKSVGSLMRKIIAVSLLVGVASALILYFSSDLVSLYWIKDERAALSLKILAPSLPFMSVSSCMKGYFTARRRISVSSGSQIFEQIIRVAIVAVLLVKFAHLGVAAACAAIMIGDTISECLSCLYLWIGYLRDKYKLAIKSEGEGEKKVLSKFFGISLPISAGAILNSSLRTVENIIVPNNLTKFNGSREQSLSEFGAIKGMALPLIFFPSSLLSAFSTLLMPEITEANSLSQHKRMEKIINQSMHLCLALSILVSGIFTAFADELGRLIYGSSEVGFYIKVLSPLIPFMYIESIVDGILKGLGQQVSSLRYNIIDSCIRIGLIVLLLPFFGINGFLLVMIISNMLTSVLNIARMIKVTGIKLNWGRILIKPCIGIVLSCLLGVMTSNLIKSGISTSAILTLIIGTAVVSAGYFAFLYVFRCLPSISRLRQLKESRAA